MPGTAPSSPKLVEVAFKHRRRDVFRYPAHLHLMAGTDVVVGLGHGIDFGHITMTGELVSLRYKKSPPAHKSVIRIAKKRDCDRHQSNRESEKGALRVFSAELNRVGKNLKAVDAEWQLDRKRITFFYTDGQKKKPKGKSKPPFKKRDLIDTLRKEFSNTQIMLQRITPREETARLGGIGVCGRELCCSSWMNFIPNVPQSAVRKQHFPMNPERVRGRCNQLKCCLNYELDHYVEVLKEFPKPGKKVSIPAGTAKVEKVDIFARTVTVRLKGGQTETLPLDALKAASPVSA